MKAKGDSTRQRLLTTGLDKLSVEGLAGITIGTLATAAGISKSGLFAHFASKEELQLQLLDEMTRVAEAHVLAPAMSRKPGLARLEALFEHWLGWSSKAGLSGGCPISAAIFELDDLGGQVRDQVVALEAQWRGVLESLIVEAMAAEEICDDTDAAQIAWEMTGIYLAHHASSRLARDRTAKRRAETAFKALMARIAARKGRR
ncbi:TetR/AcrR family transcriptional regulator [Bradyrhizobium roseum]|uniref:TetR/AcrR family transcriptional regulator n=1 Tax=Bradyrhizobium roseum TaxID=3056648 RepID=UPI00260E53FB|nr:TetR/AcrR family transcriptional regulator [Bradyrhizobium roseus]WKA29502.1 TetR/AcrR family transcriptional regulator [Bradyrhizobium roseus]